MIIKTIFLSLILLFITIACHIDGSSNENKGVFPGAISFGSELNKKIEEMKKRRAITNYKPRTKHFDASGKAKFTNRLFLESSPYLLQHAHNPVNWYPWGDEAFATAKKLHRPVLLSIGYSTCHWCHVMEEESFEDLEIAKIMNENYIAIKVDREERPDVDAIYMSAVQAMTGSGGWPMTVWVTPERKPFFGGTYFPAHDGDRGMGNGFLTLINRLKEVYDKEPRSILESSEQLVKIINQSLSTKYSGDLPDETSLMMAANYYKQAFDPIDGGIKGTLKFPSSMPIRFLLRYQLRTGKKEFLKIAEKTLSKMSSGGIYDHIGGGFHRYSTDTKWLIPHFEKMLYDNALLAMAYLEAFQLTKNKEYERVAREILDFVLRDMTSADGAFYSSTDADSIGPSGKREEGYYFTWTPSELKNILNAEELKLITAFYHVSTSGNFQGRSILYTEKSLAETAKKMKLSLNEANQILASAKEKLYKIRTQRPSPLRDEKILTSWNGLMISAFSQAGFILNESKYIEAAKNSSEFILKNLVKKDHLFHTFKDHEAKLNGYLDDYAFFTQALLDLYSATSELKWLTSAISLDHFLHLNFEDNQSGGFFMTSNDHEKLLAREKSANDGAEPSGNSIAVLNLLRLGEYTTNDEYRKRADHALKAFSKTLKENPIALSEMLLALDFRYDQPKEIIIVKPEKLSESESEMIKALRNSYLPNKIISIVKNGDELIAQSKVIPVIASKVPIDNKVTAYVCRGGVCLFPTNDVRKFINQINIPVIK